MGLSHSPRIVTDGLVFCVDAGDKMSYPGAGTTWTDLSKNRNNGTLVNGPTFDSENGGSIVFDGTNDFINLNTNVLLNNDVTLDCVFKWDDYGTNNINFITAGNNEKLELHTGGNAGTNGLRWIPYNFQGAGPSDASIDATNIITDGINHVTFTTTQNLSICYKNGERFTNSTTTSSLSIGSQPLVLGKRASNQYYFNGNIYFVKIYNRALSAAEITQNYNATRGRFQ